MNPGRIDFLDAMRGLAAFAVVWYHYTTIFPTIYPDLYDNVLSFPKGYLGVQVFFMLSGFVIFMTLEKVKSAKEFLIKRFIRLYPTYWLCILITAFFSIFQLSDKLKVTLWDVIGNFTMVQDLIRPVVSFRHVDGAYWSLMPELMFYLLMAVLLRFKLLKHIKIIGFIWICTSLICTIFDLSFLMSGVILNFRYSSLFFSGIMFYLIWKNENEQKDIINHLLIIFSLAVSVFMTMFFEQKPADCFLLVIFYLIYYLFVFGKVPRVIPDPLLFLGKVSYPWYLLHQNIGYLILFYLYRWTGISSSFMIIIPMIITCFMAYCVQRYFEKPVLKKLKVLLLK